jgi:AcrR family transcriptional regulator
MTQNLRDEQATRTRAALIRTARALFAREGYAQTSTEAILAGVGVKRGALYHHFRDKAALFEAVCLELHAEAGEAVEASIAGAPDPQAALERGCAAWLRFVAGPEARQILLADAISVLGLDRWNEMDAAFGAGLLIEGIRETPGLADFDAEALTVLLNGASFAAANWAGSDHDRLDRATETLIRLLRALPRKPI